LVVAEFHEQGFFIKLFYDRADLAAGKTLPGKVSQQCHHIQKRCPFVLCVLRHFHQAPNR
jgi:hypothetical protein